ncbi:MAG: transaldolase [Planctomycetota bacterium]|nr:transaldolase [Planctomycetota bacterium]
MSHAAIASLIHSGTKLYLDSIDPDLVKLNLAWGAVGATSNPIIISNLIRTGRFDSRIAELITQGLDDETLCWKLTDALVSQAQLEFLPHWEKSGGNTGWVSFELDPLLEDPEVNLPHNERVERYIELGRKWAANQSNRMIKVPATPAGLDAIGPLAQHGVTLNVTLIFTTRQYRIAKENAWAGAQKRTALDRFKSVYSIFVSRIDQYTAENCKGLSAQTQGLYGILNAKRIWKENQEFWAANPTPLQQEIIFASTGTKNASDAPWKYVAALAGSDIQTNPPETNAAVAASTELFASRVSELPADSLCRELDAALDVPHMEKTLMEQGVAKFVAPQKQLLQTIRDKRSSLANR